MNAIETVMRMRAPHYLLMLKLYVKPDGSLLVMMSNSGMEVTADEVHALLCGTLDFASVFEKLHSEIDNSALAILSENSSVNGHSKGE